MYTCTYIIVLYVLYTIVCTIVSGACTGIFSWGVFRGQRVFFSENCVKTPGKTQKSPNTHPLRTRLSTYIGASTSIVYY